jgi:hypothetical protein
MSTAHRRAAAAAIALLAVALTGCSPDLLIWGPDGARVIDTTEQAIAAASADDMTAFACADSAADFGEPEDWRGLSAGEPEGFTADYWPDQAALEPDWSINLEMGGSAEDGRVFPGDLFFRDADDGLCIVDIAWWTVESTG